MQFLELSFQIPYATAASTLLQITLCICGFIVPFSGVDALDDIVCGDEDVHGTSAGRISNVTAVESQWRVTGHAEILWLFTRSMVVVALRAGLKV